jgi:protein tyrosine phosphatase (PTP) superfamily phosphohydrolase (DUF442 family)
MPLLRKPPLPARLARLTNELAAGEHPSSPAQVEALARANYRAIVNLAQEGEPGQEFSPNVEATWAHTYRIEHWRFDETRYGADEIERFLALMVRVQKPVYLHSTHGNRAFALAAILIGRERGLGDEAARQALAVRGASIDDPGSCALVRTTLGE